MPTTAATPRTFAIALLQSLGLPTSTNNVTSIVAWEKLEGGNFADNGTARYNPLNTTMDAPGATSFGVGIKQYASWADGVDATKRTLLIAHYGYPAILAALRASAAPSVTMAAVDASSWGTHVQPGTQWTDSFLQAAAASYMNTPDPEHGSLSITDWTTWAFGGLVVAGLAYVFFDKQLAPYVAPVVRPIQRLVR